VDGSGVGDIGWPEVRDRDRLAQAVYFFAVVPTDGRGGLTGPPQLSTRGFVNEKEAEQLLSEAEELIVRTAAEARREGQPITPGQIEGALNRFLYDETRKRPVIQVVVCS